MAPNQVTARQIFAELNATWRSQRGFVRYQCALATPGKVDSGEKHIYLNGWVLDLSRTGTGFLLGKPLPLGQDVTLHIDGETKNKRQVIPAQVIHSTERPGGEWVVGFEFEKPLTDHELELLL